MTHFREQLVERPKAFSEKNCVVFEPVLGTGVQENALCVCVCVRAAVTN